MVALSQCDAGVLFDRFADRFQCPLRGFVVPHADDHANEFVNGRDVGTLERALLDELDGLSSVDQKELDRAVALTETHILRKIQQTGSRADLLSSNTSVPMR